MFTYSNEMNSREKNEVLQHIHHSVFFVKLLNMIQAF